MGNTIDLPIQTNGNPPQAVTKAAEERVLDLYEDLDPRLRSTMSASLSPTADGNWQLEFSWTESDGRQGVSVDEMDNQGDIVDSNIYWPNVDNPAVPLSEQQEEEEEEQGHVLFD
jgi:hypothetical protein